MHRSCFLNVTRELSTCRAVGRFENGCDLLPFEVWTRFQRAPLLEYFADLKVGTRAVPGRDWPKLSAINVAN